MFSSRCTAFLAPGLAIALLLAACGDGGGTATPGDCPTEPVRIVVSVSQWGDIVSDLAGDCGQVTTIISGTSVDPHDYEPVPADLATFTDARLVVVNGLDYDAWAEKALDAQSPKPAVVDAGDVAGRSPGDNPHLWYAPDFVSAMADAVTTELETVAPDGAAYFEQKATAWRASMQPYFNEVSDLGAAIAGAKSYVATEPVFDYMAQAIGLVDETPHGFAAPRRTRSILRQVTSATSRPR